MTTRDDVTGFLNQRFASAWLPDRSLNGLQVHGDDTVTGIALGVDACQVLFQQAAERNLNYVIVHHGIFWGASFAITPMWGERFKTLLNNNMSLYACHLPMDAESEHGHNAGIADRLKLDNREPFGLYKGNKIGVRGDLPAPMTLDTLTARLQGWFGNDIRVMPFGATTVDRVAVVTGAACDMEMLEEVKASGAQLFITGETDHASYHIIRELGLNVAFCGHYQTETTALKNLAPALTDAFNIPVSFIDIPTGL